LESSDNLSKIDDFFIFTVDDNGLLSDLGLIQGDMLCNSIDFAELFFVLAVFYLELFVAASPFLQGDCCLLVFLIQF
jgi:hypothetical protein